MGFLPKKRNRERAYPASMLMTTSELVTPKVKIMEFFRAGNIDLIVVWSRSFISPQTKLKFSKVRLPSLMNAREKKMMNMNTMGMMNTNMTAIAMFCFFLSECVRF
jgi:hypothetical protein